MPILIATTISSFYVVCYPNASIFFANDVELHFQIFPTQECGILSSKETFLKDMLKAFYCFVAIRATWRIDYLSLIELVRRGGSLDPEAQAWGNQQFIDAIPKLFRYGLLIP